MKVVQELVAYFDTRGKLSGRQLKKLLDQSRIAADAPSSMHGLCDIVGATYYFRITGVTEGQVWGTDTYTREFHAGGGGGACRIAEAGRKRGAARQGRRAAGELSGHPAQRRDDVGLRRFSARLDAFDPLKAAPSLGWLDQRQGQAACGLHDRVQIPAQRGMRNGLPGLFLKGG